METIEHFARISLTARLLGREHLLSREEVMRLQDLRGSYGIASPAPICPDPMPVTAEADPTCQVVQAPASSGGPARAGHERRGRTGRVSIGTDGEIRLTYAQLTELIDEAVRQLGGSFNG
jgi:L-fuculose-phosphate aldolase